MDPFCRTLHVVGGVLPMCKNLWVFQKTKCSYLTTFHFPKCFMLFFYFFSWYPIGTCILQWMPCRYSLGDIVWKKNLNNNKICQFFYIMQYPLGRGPIILGMPQPLSVILDLNLQHLERIKCIWDSKKHAKELIGKILLISFHSWWALVTLTWWVWVEMS